MKMNTLPLSILPLPNTSLFRLTRLSYTVSAKNFQVKFGFDKSNLTAKRSAASQNIAVSMSNS